MDSIIACRACNRAARFSIRNGWQGWYSCCGHSTRASRLSAHFYVREPRGGEWQGR